MSEEFDGWDEIDWDIDIDSARFQLHIIEAWNKNNPNVKDEWTQWPNELGKLKLILLPLGYIPSSWDKKSELTEEESEQLKKDWLKLAQYISETDAIEIEENTFTVIGQHGSNFRFDISLEFHRWLPPNTLDMHYAALRNIRNGARNKHVLGNHIANLEACLATWEIETNSEKTGFGFSSFPEHMTKYKDMEFQDAHINPQGETFPESLLLMIKLLVEDEEVWNIINQQELDRRKFAEEFEEKWPNGRPDDWMYL